MDLTLASALDALTRDRLFDLARVFGLRLTPRTLPKRDTHSRLPASWETGPRSNCWTS